MRILIRSLGELFITAGVVLLLFCAYGLWGTGQYTSGQQDQLSDRLDTAWRDSTSERVDVGKGFAVLRIPRFGDDFRYVVVEGTGRDDLRKGPGHMPRTAMPGEVGNFVLAGHRVTYGAPFNRLGKLRVGDRILVDTRDAQLVYEMTGREIVDPGRVDAVAPVPFHPRKRPEDRLITLTTCHPKYSAAQRMAVYGELVERRARVPDERSRGAQASM